MRWSWRLGRFFGIDVFVHATFLILIGWVLLSHWLTGESLAAAVQGAGFILACLAVWCCTSMDTRSRRAGTASRPVTSPCCPLAESPAWRECPTSRCRNCGWPWLARQSTSSLP